MSAEPSGPSVVAFGAGDDPADRSGRPGDRLLRIARDWRVSAGVATLAAGAACVSLFASWFGVVLPLGEPDPTTGNQSDRLTLFHLGDLGPLATAYLLCLVALTVTTVLTLFGPPAARRALRLGGLALTGASLAILVALVGTIDNYIRRSFFFLFEVEYDVDSRAGLTVAFLAVLLAGLALFLAGRTPHHPAGETPVAWGWQPPRQPHDETAAEVAAAAPLDLSVQPARPFARPESDDGRGR
ncbi:hypothetical protein O7635_09555 [Asanoa sp. WMMD1127]|uniref:hypothetical protein n=1 Tax=Asanoa sp. WMMD1127 TaxID=3016107 RepID=UPI00241728D0|nr:hypothetical protein [Asanoa sp. WMMD1127]MDG4822098.1 hypothetical protein [Asanoa sp. WMMD1127]